MALRVGVLRQQRHDREVIGRRCAAWCAPVSNYLATPRGIHSTLMHWRSTRASALMCWTRAYGWRFVGGSQDHRRRFARRLVGQQREKAVDAGAQPASGLASVSCHTGRDAACCGAVTSAWFCGDHDSATTPVNFWPTTGQGRLPLKVRAWLDFAWGRARQFIRLKRR